MAKGKFELAAFEANLTSRDFSLWPSPASRCAFENCDFSAAFLDFVPSLPANAIFLAIFGLLIGPQIYLGKKYFLDLTSFTFTIVIGLALEAVGYAAGIQLHLDPATLPFPLVCLAAAPTCIAGAIYSCLRYVYCIYNPAEARFFDSGGKALRVWIFFRCMTLFGMVILLGSAIVGWETDVSIGHRPHFLGTTTVFLIVSYASQIPPAILSCILYVRFIWNIKNYSHLRDNPELRHLNRCLLSLLLANICVLVSCIYRTVIVSLPAASMGTYHEAFTVVFDGAMLVLACLILTIMHPGATLSKAYSVAYWKNPYCQTMAVGSAEDSLSSTEKEG